MFAPSLAAVSRYHSVARSGHTEPAAGRARGRPLFQWFVLLLAPLLGLTALLLPSRGSRSRLLFTGALALTGLALLFTAWRPPAYEGKNEEGAWLPALALLSIALWLVPAGFALWKPQRKWFVLALIPCWLGWAAGGVASFRDWSDAQPVTLPPARTVPAASLVPVPEELPPHASPQLPSGPLDLLDRQDVASGAGCGVGDGRENLLVDMPEDGNSIATLKIKGQLLHLKLRSSTGTPQASTKPGDIFSRTYANDQLSIRLEFKATSICAPDDEECEAIGYSVELILNEGGRERRQHHLAGLCGS